ncbi:hypothetical protein STAS_30550 [Striga asiatica]|uniref:Uncharacterized protein n=1 Tax=Striga asiatica TaxID=4170 RepID=A0A5A7R6L1_STRAF|nr:hypothetical protein STAS_30550 [Striga asiatica]
MPRNIPNSDGKIGARKSRVRKRVSSSSSSSALHQSCRLKRAFLVGKKAGSSTPVPRWKTMGSKLPSTENDVPVEHSMAANNGQIAKGSSTVSARKLAAALWEIDGLSEVGIFRKYKDFECSKLGSKALVLSDLSSSHVSEMMDLSKAGSHRRGTSSASSQKTVHTDCDLGSGKSIHDCLVEIDHAQNPARSPSKGSKNHLKDVYNGLVTSKELLKVMARISSHDTTSISLFSALKFELDRACAHVAKLIQEQNQNRKTEIETLFKHFQEEKALLKSRHHDKIRHAISSAKIELEKEKKLRQQTERLNKKLGKELFETKELLSKAEKDLGCEKRAREILEQVCDELARGVGEDKAEVEEIKRQSAKVCEEIEKEREMLQVADSLREERVQMKLLEAKYQFEEKNAIVDELRHELESYLKSKKGEEERETGCGSPSYDKIRELQKYLHETLPCTYKYEDKGKDEVKIVNKSKNDDDEDEEDDDDSDGDDDSDLHSIELNVDDVSKNFKWGDAVRNRRSRKIRKPVREWEFSSSRGNGEDLDEIERYNMIKDLRDHIVSGSKMSSTQNTVSPSQNELGREGVVCSKDQNRVICHG